MKYWSYALLGCTAFALPAMAQDQVAARSEAADVPELTLAADKALDEQDMETAVELLSKLVEARRPADGIPRRDPLLNALFGRMVAVTGERRRALAFLDRIEGEGIPAELFAEASVDRAAVLLRLGDQEKAAAALASMPADLPATERLRADILAARVQMVSDPKAAAAMLQSLLPHAAADHGWEIRLLLSRAYSLSGDMLAAKVAADSAWALAPSARATEVAPRQVATQLASLARMRSDKPAYLAMLVAAGAERVIPVDLGGHLPVCGRDGVRADDFVEVALFTDDVSPQPFAPVAASRPEVVRAFMNALNGVSRPVAFSDSEGASLATLRCRRVAASDLPVAAADEQTAWAAERGLYWSGSIDNLNSVSELGRRIEELSVEFGAEHPFLIPHRFAFAEAIRARALTIGDVEMWQADEQVSKASAALRAVGGVENFIPSEEAAKQLAALTRDWAQNPVTARARAQHFVETLSPPLALTFARYWWETDVDMPDPVREKLYSTLLERLKHRPEMRPALLRRLADAQKAMGRVAEASRNYAAAGLPADACAISGGRVKGEESPIDADDYPTDAQLHSFKGVTLAEASIAKDGTAAGPARILMSQPSGIFDETVLSSIGQFSFEAAERDGKSIMCIGATIPLNWRLADEGEDERAGDGFGSLFPSGT